MNQHIQRFLTDLTADHKIEIDIHELAVAATIHTDDVKAWLDDLGRLATADLWRTVLADAFESAVDLAGDARLDGHLGDHAALLSQIIGAACDLDDEHDTVLTRFLTTGRHLAILDDLTATTPPVATGEPHGDSHDD